MRIRLLKRDLPLSPSGLTNKISITPKGYFPSFSTTITKVSRSIAYHPVTNLRFFTLGITNKHTPSLITNNFKHFNHGKSNH